MINCEYNYISMGKVIYRIMKKATRKIENTHVVFTQKQSNP